MKPTTYDEARLIPLTTDALIQDRVSDLIGRAIRRQLWLLFLDENQVQLPTLMPLDGMPLLPTERDGLTLPIMLRQLVETVQAHSLVFVLERYGGAELTPSDLAWARALHSGCEEAGVPLRAVLVSHRRGVRWLAQDDYRFGAPVGG